MKKQIAAPPLVKLNRGLARREREWERGFLRAICLKLVCVGSSHGAPFGSSHSMVALCRVSRRALEQQELFLQVQRTFRERLGTFSWEWVVMTMVA